MSLSISALSSNSLNYLSDRDAPVPKPTVEQQMQTLATSGQSAQQIATKLDLPLSQVDSALGVTSTASSANSALVAASARFSVHA